MAEVKIDWKKLWREFEAWCAEKERTRIKCPSWERQQKHIQWAVNRAIKEAKHGS